MLRVSILLLVLFAAFAVRAMAEDNWLIGTWSTSTGLSYVFTAADVTLSGPGGKSGPYKASYDIAGDTITVVAEGIGQAILKKTDATHATLNAEGGPPAELTKQ
jgi:hypothetical protein